VTDEIVQGSPEWHAIRCGKATASRIFDILATTKSGPSASRKNYMAQLVAERLTGIVAEGFRNAAIDHGNEYEPEARSAYCFRVGVDVEEVGFCAHPTIDMSGASPDGLVGADGLVEIKCPNTATHIETLLGGSVPSKYELQMLWQMACTGRKWCDFVSYDPRMPETMRLFVRRMNRDDARITEVEEQVLMFLGETERVVAQLRRAYE
jgi:putative phage-type endonuclease